MHLLKTAIGSDSGFSYVVLRDVSHIVSKSLKDTAGLTAKCFSKPVLYSKAHLTPLPTWILKKRLEVVLSTLTPVINVEQLTWHYFWMLINHIVTLR